MDHSDQQYKIADIECLAAMTHPLRRRLMDLLDLEGPATTAALATRTGLPATVVDRHLAILATAGFADSDSDDGRTRWRLATETIAVLTNELPDDPVSKIVIGAAHTVTLDRLVGFMRQWAVAREGFTPEWAASGFMTDSWLRLTPAELAELRGEMTALLIQWSERTDVDDGQERHPIFAGAQAVRVLP